MIPSRSSLPFPFHFRRNQESYISSIINWNCPSSFVLRYQWSIHNCSAVNCPDEFRLESTLLTSSSDLFLPRQTLPLGVYQLQLSVTMNVSSNVFTRTESTYVRITPSGITTNLVPLGTSMISSGAEQNLQFNPGNYSIDLDGKPFNASVNDLLFKSSSDQHFRIGPMNIGIESIPSLVFLSCVPYHLILFALLLQTIEQVSDHHP